MYFWCTCLTFNHKLIAKREGNDMSPKIFIDLVLCKLQLQEEGKVIKVYPVAVGAKKTPSPVGIYSITNKAHWGGAFGTRWMQLSVPWGTYGIHGTNRPASIGQPVSHGCIRMQNRDVEEVYKQVDVDTPVHVVGPITYQLSVNGSRGNLVQLIQQALQEQEYYQGICDGIFEVRTEKAICQWQKEKKLPITGQVNEVNLLNLGIVL